MQQSYSKSFVFSVLLHLIVIFLLMFSYDFTSNVPVLENSNVINAVIISSAPPETKRIMPQTIIAKAPAPTPTPIKKPLPVAKPIEKQKIIEPKKEAIALEVKKPKPILNDDIQKELLAEITKHKIAVKKVKQKKITQKSLEKEFEKELKDLSAKTLQQQLLSEQKHLNNIQEQKSKGVVDKYKALILQAIGQQWLIPIGIDKKLSAHLLIVLAPGGTVIDVQIQKSSGNVALDSSAKAAVFKASPLPVPVDASEFEPFRRFVLVVKPMLFENTQIGV